jgi:nucleotide-binding universal stress UspA family protein
VLVVYEDTPAGRAALLTARARAVSAGAPLTVMTVACRERTDIGCAACRSAAAFHNQLACEIAADELAKAKALLDENMPGPETEYVLGRGTFARATAAVAQRRAAIAVVLPARRGWTLFRRLSRDRAKAVRRRGDWPVIVAADH